MSKDYVFLTPEGKGILGTMDDDGVVTFAVDAGPGSSVRGTELFEAMMAYFGEEARAVRGVWRRSLLGRTSVNIDKVNELTAASMPLEEAILHTWTFTRAKKLGFTKARVLGMPSGQPGGYIALDVLIEK